MRFIAWFLSVVFFPLFIPIYGSFLLFSMELFSYYPSFYIWNAYIAIFAFGTLIPFLSIFILYKLKVASDIGLTKQKDRTVPYLCTAFSCFICALALDRLAMPMFVPMLAVGAAVSLFINSIVTLWWKISAHMTGIGGLFGGILFVSYQFQINPYEWIIATLLVSGMIASARLYLNAHTPGQLVAGFLNGALCTIIIPGLNLGCWLRLW